MAILSQEELQNEQGFTPSTQKNGGYGDGEGLARRQEVPMSELGLSLEEPTGGNHGT